MARKIVAETLAEFGAVIRKARQECKLTLDDVAAATGISKPYLSNIETARTAGPASDGKLGLLEGVLGFGAGELVEAGHWLRTPASVRARVTGAAGPVARRADGTQDLDSMLKSVLADKTPTGEAGRAEGAEAGGGIRMIPLINRVPAGAAGEYTDLDYPAGVADRYLPVPTGLGAAAADRGGEASFALVVAGDSMEPEYRAGDILIVGSGEARQGDDCLVRLGEAENFATTFKRISFVYADKKAGEEGGERVVTHVRLVPLNKEHVERTVALDHISSIFPVLWKMTPAAGRAGGQAGVGMGGGAARAEVGAGMRPKRAKEEETRFFSDLDLTQD